MITFFWNFGSRIRVTDSQSGFRAYNKRVVQDLELTENGMSLSIEILEKIRKKKPGDQRGAHQAALMKTIIAP